MGDLEPITRNEKLWSGEDLTPVTRREMYIKHLYDETQVIPEYPVTREEMFILKAGEELHDVTIEQLTATENKTYSEEGVAYSPVIVNVPQTTLTTLDVTENGTYTAPSGTAYSEVDVDVPLPENAYLLKEIEDVEIASFNDGSDLPMPKLEVAIEPVQDLHGYDAPWVGGAGKNKLDFTDTTVTSSRTIASDISLKAGDYIVAFDIKNNSNIEGYYQVRIGTTGIGGVNFGANYSGRLSKTFTLSEDSVINIFVAGVSSGYSFEFSKGQIELGSSATTFAPYSNICPIIGWDEVDVTVADDVETPTVSNVYTLDLDGTRYGGKVDLVSGVMMITHGYATLRDLEWTHASPSGSIAYDYFTTTSLSSIIKPMSGSTEVTTILNSAFPKCTSSQVAKDGYDKYLAQGGYSIFISDSDYTTVNDFLAEFGNQQLVYELATPLTIQLTPTVVKSLRGMNNVWADTGNILDLSYLAKEE